MSINVDEPRDFIDHFLIEQMKNDLQSTFTDSQLVASVVEFLFAGHESTETTINWFSIN